MEKLPRVANHKTAAIPTYGSIYAQVDCYTEKIGVVYETVSTNNWGRAVAHTSVKLLKEAHPQIVQEWGVEYFPLGVYCDFDKLHYMVTKKRLDDAKIDSIKTKLKCDRAGFKSDWDRAEYDFFRAIKSFNLKALRQVLTYLKSFPGNTKNFQNKKFTSLQHKNFTAYNKLQFASKYHC